jgi:hypothetical protein
MFRGVIKSDNTILNINGVKKYDETEPNPKISTADDFKPQAKLKPDCSPTSSNRTTQEKDSYYSDDSSYLSLDLCPKTALLSKIHLLQP